MEKASLYILLTLILVSCHPGKREINDFLIKIDSLNQEIFRMKLENGSILPNSVQQRKLFYDYLQAKISLTIKVTKKFETFDVDAFNRNKNKYYTYSESGAMVSYSYNTQFDSGIKLRINEDRGDIIYIEFHPDSYLAIYKAYYLNGYIKAKGVISLTFDNFGEWYYYDRSGKLTEKTDWDKLYKFTFDDVLAFCKQEGISVQKENPLFCTPFFGQESGVC
jgi:hypothetical protein